MLKSHFILLLSLFCLAGCNIIEKYENKDDENKDGKAKKSLPNKPVETQTLWDSFGASVKNVIDAGSFVYVAKGFGGIEVYQKLSDNRLALVGKYRTSGSIVDILIPTPLKHLFALENKKRLIVMDKTDPSQLKVISTHVLKGEPKKMIHKRDYLFVAYDYGSVEIFRFNESGNVSKISEFKTDKPVNDIAVSETLDRLFIADSEQGLLAVDISSISSPVILGQYKNGSSIVAAVSLALPSDPNYLYMASDNKNILKLNIKNPKDIKLDSTISIPEGNVMNLGIRNFSSPSSSVLFASIRNTGVALYRNDLRESLFTEVKNVSRIAYNGTLHLADQKAGIILAKYKNTFANPPVIEYSYRTISNPVHVNVTKDNKHVLVADQTFGLILLDITNRGQAFIIGDYETPNGAKGIDLSSDGKIAFLSAGSDGMYILNIEDKSNPVLLSQIPAVGDFTKSEYIEGSKLLFIAAGDQGVVGYDVSNLSAPVLKMQYDTNGIAKDVKIGNSRLYVADGNDGIKGFTFTSSTITLDGHYVTSGDASCVKPHSFVVFVCDGNKGIQVVQTGFSSNFTFIERLPTKGIALRAEVFEKEIFVASQGEGIVYLSSENDSGAWLQKSVLGYHQQNDESFLSEPTKDIAFTHDKETAVIADSYLGVMFVDYTNRNAPKFKKINMK